MEDAIQKGSGPRWVVLTTFTLSILVLLLHFPFDGYVSEYSYTVPSFTACPQGDLKQRLRELGAEEFNKAIQACSDDYVTKEFPISDWRSNGAPIYWFASPIHALASILAIWVIGLVWYFSVRPKRTAAK